MLKRILPLLLLFSGSAWADFATLSSLRTSLESSNLTTSHGVDLPLTINAGDVCLVLFAIDGNATITWDDTTVGAWTQEVSHTADTNAQAEIYKKVMDGTEDGAELIVGTSVGEPSSHISTCWGNVNGGLAGVESAFTDGNSINPDPPSLTPTWGSDDVTWIAAAAIDTGTNGVVTAFPEPDNQTQVQSNTNSNAISAAISSDEATAISRDPGTYTITGADQWITFTVGVRGAVAASSIAPLAQQYIQENSKP